MSAPAPRFSSRIAPNTPRARCRRCWSRRSASPRLSSSACMAASAPARARPSGNIGPMPSAIRPSASTGINRRVPSGPISARMNGRRPTRCGCGRRPRHRMRFQSHLSNTTKRDRAQLIALAMASLAIRAHERVAALGSPFVPAIRAPRWCAWPLGCSTTRPSPVCPTRSGCRDFRRC